MRLLPFVAMLIESKLLISLFLLRHELVRERSLVISARFLSGRTLGLSQSGGSYKSHAGRLQLDDSRVLGQC